MAAAEPAAAAGGLHPDAVRRRLAGALAAEAPADWLGGDEGALTAHGPRPLTPAAVLIGLVPRHQGTSVLLTQRTAHLKDHAGQISFPGGRIEPTDPDAVAAALREAHEEIGLEPARVQVLGGLRTYDTGTGFRIHPVVGWVDPPDTFELDAFEVAELFELPLAWALEPANHRRDSGLRGGRRRQFYVLPFEDRYIWGATAAILVNLARILRG